MSAHAPGPKDSLRDQECPEVLGYKLDRQALTPIREMLDPLVHGKDFGADPLEDGTFRMVPSGDIVSLDERNRRLAK